METTVRVGKSLAETAAKLGFTVLEDPKLLKEGTSRAFYVIGEQEASSYRKAKKKLVSRLYFATYRWVPTCGCGCGYGVSVPVDEPDPGYVKYARGEYA